MKRIIFSSFLIAGLLISLSGFSAPADGGHRGHGRGGGYGYRGGYGVHGGFGFHTGFGYGAPRIYYRPVPAPIIYGPAYPPVYEYNPYYYSQPYYVHPYYHRCRRW
jgi:hypothetical protein